ncbi:MAG TPA: hypothetical protein VFT87_05365 [Candidatus Saccharimonadales bacterium]|nr:hypothetical protein [Candidatus Saccharimonadales bacterium]
MASKKSQDVNAMADIICQMVVRKIIQELKATKNVARARQAELLQELIYFIQALTALDGQIGEESQTIIAAAQVPYGPDKKRALAHSRRAQSNIATHMTETKWLTDIDFALASLHETVVRCLTGSLPRQEVSYFAGLAWTRIAQILELSEATHANSLGVKREVEQYLGL